MLQEQLRDSAQRKGKSSPPSFPVVKIPNRFPGAFLRVPLHRSVRVWEERVLTEFNTKIWTAVTQFWFKLRLEAKFGLVSRIELTERRGKVKTTYNNENHHLHSSYSSLSFKDCVTGKKGEKNMKRPLLKSSTTRRDLNLTDTSAGNS